MKILFHYLGRKLLKMKDLKDCSKKKKKIRHIRVSQQIYHCVFW